MANQTINQIKMTKEEAKQKCLELHAAAGDSMMEEYDEDYFDWLSATEQVEACEIEKVLFGNEFCICGEHDDIEKAEAN